MGCGSSIEDQVLLAKLDRLEIKVKKEKELKKLSEIEGRPIGNLNSGFDTRTERNRRVKTTPNDRYLDTYTTKDRSKKKKGSEKKSKKKKDKDEKSKKKTRAVSEGVTKKKKKKK